MEWKARHLKPFWNKKNILLVSLLLIFGITAGVTFAWLTGFDGSKSYTLQGAYVDCDTTFTATQRSASATVTNTGNADAYIRVELICHYREKLGSNQYGTLFYTQPKFDSTCPCTSATIDSSSCNCDYTFTINTEAWVQGDDGYYYHKQPVTTTNKTEELFTDFAIRSGSAPNGYEFRIEVLGTAIQADPDGEAAIDAWGVTIENGVITAATGLTS